MIKKTIISFFLIFLTLCCTSNKEKAEEQYLIGKRFLHQFKTDSALARFQKALSYDPRHIDANTAFQEMDINKYARADELYDDYLAKAEAHPDDEVYQYLFGRLIDNEHGKIELAENTAEMAPNFFGGFMLLGDSYLEAGYDLEAFDAYKKVIDLDHRQISPYRHNARILETKGEYIEAAALLKTAYNIDTSQTDLLISLWQTRIRAAGFDSTSIQHYSRKADSLLKKKKNNPRALTDLINFYKRYRPRNLADSLKKIIIKLAPNGLYAEREAFKRIFGLKEKNERAVAVKDYLKRFPYSKWKKYIFMQKLRHTIATPDISEDSVLTVFNEWLNIIPKDFSAYEILTSRYYLLIKEDYDKAIQYARIGYDSLHKSRKGNMLEIIGWANYKKGNYQEALAAILQAGRLLPRTNHTFKYRLGACYYRTDSLDKALYYLGKSIAQKETEYASELFSEVYSKKHGTKAGAAAYLQKEILGFAAPENPYPAPDFMLEDLDGGKIELSGFKGKIVLIHFWKPG